MPSSSESLLLRIERHVLQVSSWIWVLLHHSGELGHMYAHCFADFLAHIWRSILTHCSGLVVRFESSRASSVLPNEAGYTAVASLIRLYIGPGLLPRGSHLVSKFLRGTSRISVLTVHRAGSTSAPFDRRGRLDARFTLLLIHSFIGQEIRTSQSYDAEHVPVNDVQEMSLALFFCTEAYLNFGSAKVYSRRLIGSGLD